jgi:hypothetical protein
LSVEFRRAFRHVLVEFYGRSLPRSLNYAGGMPRQRLVTGPQDASSPLPIDQTDRTMCGMKRKRTTKRTTPRNTKKHSRKRRVPAKTYRRGSNDVRRTTQRGKRKDTRKSIPHAIRLMRRQGLSLAKAARTAGVSPRTVRRIAGSALRKGPNGRYVVQSRDRFVRVVYVLTAEGKREVSLKSSREASIVGRHWNAVHAYAARGESAGLRRFDGVEVTGVGGARYTLLTDLAAIERLGNAGELSFETIYNTRTR